MSDYRNYSQGQGKKKGGTPSWGLTILGLVLFPPVGFVLLFWKLMRLGTVSARTRVTGQHPYYTQQAARQQGQTAPHQTAQPRQTGAQHTAPPPQAARAGGALPKYHQYVPVTKQALKRQRKAAQRAAKAAGIPSGRGLVVGGSILAGIFGVSALTVLIEALRWGWWGGELPVVFLLSLVFAGVGGVMVAAGILRGKNGRRYRKYLSYIGRRDTLSIATLAQAMGMSYNKVCDDLQDMLDRRILPTGYIDYQQGRLVLSDEGIADSEPSVSAPASTEERMPGPSAEDKLLAEIRGINDLIDDHEMSLKIDRIGEITAKILTYQRNNPTRAGQLRQFLGYYMPTTLKLLRHYAQLEDQGIEGENITSAKARIEGVMDKVVEGFEKQLDHLFQNDAMDITTDVAVLERMIERDGLAGGEITLQI